MLSAYSYRILDFTVNYTLLYQSLHVFLFASEAYMCGLKIMEMKLSY